MAYVSSVFRLKRQATRRVLFRIGCCLLQVRAIDPAGNRDPYLLDRNVYTWTYVPPLPWLLIILAIIIIVTAIITAIMYVRHKRRKMVLERYAMKRRQRKLKVGGRVVG